jgi:ABC-type polysaccharide/polyol phosphate export permease
MMNTHQDVQLMTRYDSSHRGPLAIEELKGVLKYRELIFQLVRCDLIARYKRSVLGIAWTMLTPLGTMLILTLVFSNLFHAVQGYPVYVLSGLIAWIFFSQTISASLHQNVWGGALLHRVYIPRTVFTISSLITGLVNLLLSLVPLALIMAIVRFPFHFSLLFLPVPILIVSFFTLGLALLFSTLAIYFPDIVDMVQVALTAWMYLTPIIYPLDIIPSHLRQWIINLNPMYYFIEIIRQPIYMGKIPSMHLLVISATLSVIFFICGWLVFSWKANELTYRT